MNTLLMMTRKAFTLMFQQLKKLKVEVIVVLPAVEIVFLSMKYLSKVSR